jgi:hypothetical protein
VARFIYDASRITRKWIISGHIDIRGVKNITLVFIHPAINNIHAGHIATHCGIFVRHVVQRQPTVTINDIIGGIIRGTHNMRHIILIPIGIEPARHIATIAAEIFFHDGLFAYNSHGHLPTSFPLMGVIMYDIQNTPSAIRRT